MSTEYMRGWSDYVSEARRADKEGVVLDDTAQQLKKYVTEDGKYFINFSNTDEEIRNVSASSGKEHGGKERGRTSKTHLPLSLKPREFESEIGGDMEDGMPTPMGIYAYPLTDEIYGQLVQGGLPFASDRGIITVFKPKSSAFIIDNNRDMTDLEEIMAELSSDPQKYKKYTGDSMAERSEKEWLNYFDEFEQMNAGQQSEAAKIWNLTWQLLDDAYGDKRYQLWNHFCRKLGIDGFIDNGEGYIHFNEPEQAVFFHSAVVKVEEVIVNKYRPIDIQNVHIAKNKTLPIFMKWAEKYYEVRTGNKLPRFIKTGYRQGLSVLSTSAYNGWRVTSAGSGARDLSPDTFAAEVQRTVPATMKGENSYISPAFSFANMTAEYWRRIHDLVVEKMKTTGDAQPEQADEWDSMFKKELYPHLQFHVLQKQFKPDNRTKNIDPKTLVKKREALEALDKLFGRWEEYEGAFKELFGTTPEEYIGKDDIPKGYEPEKLKRPVVEVSRSIDKGLSYAVSPEDGGVVVKAILATGALEEAEGGGDELARLKAVKSKPFKTLRGPLGPMKGDEGKPIAYYTITQNAMAKGHPKVGLVSKNKGAIEDMYVKLLISLSKMNKGNPIWVMHANNATNKVWDDMLKNRLLSVGSIGYYSPNRKNA